MYQGINLNAVTGLAVATFGVIGAIFLGFVVTSQDSNALAETSKYLTFALCILGAVNPRLGLYVLIFLTAYSDLVKRFLILYGGVSFQDITAVLAACPILTATLVLGCIIRRLFQQDVPSLKEIIVILLGLSMIAFSAISSRLMGSDLTGILKDMANNGVYVAVPWLALNLLKDEQEMHRIFKFAILVYAPVAAYGIYQAFFGYSRLEINYLLSGLTITVGLLDQAHQRPFSTLNSPHAYSGMAAFMMGLAFFYIFSRKSNRIAYILLFLLYTIAVFTSFGRSSMVWSVLTIATWIMFRNKTLTKLFYLSVLSGFTVLIFNAEFLIDRLAWFETMLPIHTEWQQQLLQVQTMSDRLMGYRNVLLNPSTWKLVGDLSINTSQLSYSEAGFSHDLLSQLILRLGILPTALLSAMVAFVIFKTHSLLLRTPTKETRDFAAMLAALVVVFIFSNLLGNSFHVFPLNFWFWLFSGCLLQILTTKPTSPLPFAPKGDSQENP